MRQPGSIQCVQHVQDVYSAKLYKVSASVAQTI
jgi:hypothetical protein